MAALLFILGFPSAIIFSAFTLSKNHIQFNGIGQQLDLFPPIPQ